MGELHYGSYGGTREVGSGVKQYYGDATVWDDLQGSLINKKLYSTAGKLDYNWDENAIAMQPGGDISNKNDRLCFNYQYPHGAVNIDGVMNLHIHWEQATADNIEWTVQYRLQPIGGEKATDWTTVTANSHDNSVFEYASGTIHQVTALCSVDMDSMSMSSIVQFRLARTDNVAININALYIDAHVKIDMAGSREEYQK